MESGMQMTFGELLGETCQKQIVGASAHLAKVSPWLENEQDLTEQADLFEKFSVFCPNSKRQIDPNGLSTKTLRECLQAAEDLISSQFSLKWGAMGTISNGLLLTASITEYPRTGSACTLSDILEPVVSEKYFLSGEQIKKIVFAE